MPKSHEVEPSDGSKCAHCGGPKDIRNPTGRCDHLYWPDHLTDEAKIANGYRKSVREVWRSSHDA